MSDTHTIRPADLTLQEAEAILRVERESLADTPYDASGILTVMRRPAHETCVATVGGDVVGFCSTFATPSADGVRLEIDLLGVVPAHRGRGVASRLVAVSVEGARRQGTRSCRGIVAEDNAASRRAFQRAGLQDSGMHDLLVYTLRGTAPVALPDPDWSYAARVLSAHHGPTDPPGRTILRLLDGTGGCRAEAECLRVHTFSYEGIWVERVRPRRGAHLTTLARVVVEYAKTLDVDEVGYLMPAEDGEEQRLAWVRAGFEGVGAYLVFERRE